MSILRFESSDKKIIEVDETIAKFSGIIKSMLEECGMGADKEVIPLSEVNSTILAKAFEFVDRHKSDEKSKLEQNEEDKKFFGELDQSQLFQLINAAYYLDIKNLLEMSCYTVAQQLKGKTPEEMRTLLNIENECPESESELIPPENWFVDTS